MKKQAIETTPATKPVKVSKKMPIEEFIAKLDEKDGEEDGEEEEQEGKIVRIIRLYRAGYTPKEIIGVGFNKTTVYRQTGEFKKMSAAPALRFGNTPFEIYESKVRRIQSLKKITHEEAEKLLAEKMGTVTE